jgi:hypothetical protein
MPSPRKERREIDFTLKVDAFGFLYKEVLKTQFPLITSSCPPRASRGGK